MTQKELSDLTDEELLVKAKKLKSASITRAFIVGLMAGIVIWSIAKNNLGLLMLIPLFIAYKVINKSKEDKALQAVLNERKLK